MWSYLTRYGHFCYPLCVFRTVLPITHLKLTRRLIHHNQKVCADGVELRFLCGSELLAPDEVEDIVRVHEKREGEGGNGGERGREGEETREREGKGKGVWTASGNICADGFVFDLVLIGWGTLSSIPDLVPGDGEGGCWLTVGDGEGGC